MFRVRTNTSVPHLLLLFHLSNPNEFYDRHLKLILLSHDNLENLEIVFLH